MIADASVEFPLWNLGITVTPLHAMLAVCHLTVSTHSTDPKQQHLKLDQQLRL